MPRAASVVCQPYATRDYNWFQGRTIDLVVECNTCSTCCSRNSSALLAPFIGGRRHLNAWSERRKTQKACSVCDGSEQCRRERRMAKS